MPPTAASLIPPEPIGPGLLDQWLLEPGVTFLNHGSFGAVPRVIFEHQTEWRRRIEAAPVEMLARRLDALLDDVKAEVGAWLGMRPADFGLVNNATEGVNAVLRSLPLGPGDELLTTDHVYNAIRQAMRYVAQRTGATVRELPLPMPIRSADEIAETVIGQLGPKTRLLVIDHVTSSTALVFPVERIVAECQARGVDVLIDGAHAPGMLPLDVARLGAAFYAGNLHKWTCAPKGNGFLWVRPDRQDRVKPLVISHRLGEGFGREFSWQGTRDVSAWLTLPAALRFMSDLGWDRVRAHNDALARWAHAMICQRCGFEPTSPLDGSLLGSMAAFALPPPLGDLDQATGAPLQQRLYSEFQVEMPLLYARGRCLIRVSAQAYNRREDYERAADVLAQVLRESGVKP